MKNVITATCNNCGKETKITITNLLPNSKTSAVVYGCVKCGYEDKEVKVDIGVLSGEPRYKFEDVISVDRIKDMLFETVWERMPDSKYIHVRLSDKDVAKLHSLLISKLPEKTTIVEIPDFPESRLFAEAYAKGQAIGRNNTIDDVKAVLDELFGVGDE